MGGIRSTGRTRYWRGCAERRTCAPLTLTLDLRERKPPRRWDSGGTAVGASWWRRRCGRWPTVQTQAPAEMATVAEGDGATPQQHPSPEGERLPPRRCDAVRTSGASGSPVHRHSPRPRCLAAALGPPPSPHVSITGRAARVVECVRICPTCSSGCVEHVRTSAPRCTSRSLWHPCQAARHSGGAHRHAGERL